MARTKTTTLSEAEKAFVRSLVIYEDDELLAVDKPAGLSSQGGRIDVNTLDELMAAFAKPSGVRPRLIHRLDRDTSGVLLAARSQPAAAYMGKAMMRRRIAKTYLAIVSPGAPAPPSGVIEADLLREDIGRDSRVGVVPAGTAGAKPALTRYRTLAAGAAAALVELRPETGRMHQLRVHLAHIGRPIVGDARYGGALVLGGEAVPRLMLHAASLTFPHPNEGVRTRIAAPLPEDFRVLLARLELTAPEFD
ncbi:MAG TPA: RluA family pseudouridine synthase [Caulobacteraceae bacterium]|jgi:tRNA pseudouridine32 synthase/23S rRNA pseudouridine746 synthase|nr:RluA family pseudouridine synthase [Caulobacteraceae bacterium]